MLENFVFYFCTADVFDEMTEWHTWVMAPMVGGSDPAFRTLCLRHGATSAFTEMLYADRIVESKEYRDQVLNFSGEERYICV